MSMLSLRLPESLHRMVREVAAKEAASASKAGRRTLQERDQTRVHGDSCLSGLPHA